MANFACRPSSLCMSSLENVSPLQRSLVLSQYSDANDAENSTPSKMAKAHSLTQNGFCGSMYFMA